jgi:hypothetical protein
LAIVWPCGESVDAYAAAGRGVEVPRAPCPSCGVPMSFRSGYWRYARQGVAVRIFVARGQCRRCDRSHGLLPDFCLVGRLDTVEVIGAAVARAAGVRPAAEEAGVPHTTARDWRRRHRRRAPVLAAGFAALAVAVAGSAPGLAADPERASLEALGAAWDATRGRFGGRTPPVFRFWSLVTGGAALAATRDPPWAAALGWVLMPPVP